MTKNDTKATTETTEAVKPPKKTTKKPAAPIKIPEWISVDGANIRVSAISGFRRPTEHHLLIRSSDGDVVISSENCNVDKAHKYLLKLFDPKEIG